MKTKLTSFLSTAVLFLSITASISFASESFYDKNLVRGFISIGGEYRSMSSSHMDYVNHLLFEGSGNVVVDVTDSISTIAYDSELDNYSYFNQSVVGLNLNIGAEYKKFLSWFNIQFIPTQVSKKPSSTGDYRNKLYDARWFSYGADWMFGWKLFNEHSFFNVIPSVGLGMSLLNIHFSSRYAYIKQGAAVSPGASGGYEVKNEDVITVDDRYYSNFTSAVHAELEVRFDFDPIAVGLYGGYRYVRYGTLELQTDESDDNVTLILGEPDVNGDSWFIGARITWTFLSKKQKELKLKL